MPVSAPIHCGTAGLWLFMQISHRGLRVARLFYIPESEDDKQTKKKGKDSAATDLCKGLVPCCTTQVLTCFNIFYRQWDLNTELIVLMERILPVHIRDVLYDTGTDIF